MASVKIHEEVKEESVGNSGCVLCFQKCTYKYDEGQPDEYGYRFIWRRPDGTLQAARGQARIPDAATLERLTYKAKVAGWFN